MRSFAVAYRFAGTTKHSQLPEWLADSLDDRFEGDLGLIQTTRLPVHQTKVRLLAAAIDAVEQAEDRSIELEAVDAAVVERGLLLCVDRHRQAWRDLGLGEPPTFAHAFELYAGEPREPAFMQCPVPNRKSIGAPARGIKLLPDFGFAVPSLVEAEGSAEPAFQLMAFAGKQFYVKGQPTGSRPLAQAVSIDLPGKPAWRFRHEVETTLAQFPFGRDVLGFTGEVVFAWLLPFLPNGRPIPRALQHPFLLDVGSPVRIDQNGLLVLYSMTCRVGASDMQLGNSALGPRDAWVASALPCVPLVRSGSRRRKTGRKAGGVDALAAADLEVKPEFQQKPLGKVPDCRKLVELIKTARFGPTNEKLGTPALDIYTIESESGRPFDLPSGATLVVEGELIGVSTTESWLDIRIPLPDPAAGAETVRDRWIQWQEACQRQLERWSEVSADLQKVIRRAFILRQGTDGRKSGRRTIEEAGRIAGNWAAVFEQLTEGEFWRVAARTYNDRDQNMRQWSDVLGGAKREVARRAFESLGGFDDPATAIAAARSGLLERIEVREAA